MVRSYLIGNREMKNARALVVAFRGAAAFRRSAK